MSATRRPRVSRWTYFRESWRLYPAANGLKVALLLTVCSWIVINRENRNDVVFDGDDGWIGRTLGAGGIVMFFPSSDGVAHLIRSAVILMAIGAIGFGLGLLVQHSLGGAGVGGGVLGWILALGILWMITSHPADKESGDSI